jgi:hypothetical protein
MPPIRSGPPPHGIEKGAHGSRLLRAQRVRHVGWQVVEAGEDFDLARHGAWLASHRWASIGYELGDWLARLGHDHFVAGQHGLDKRGELSLASGMLRTIIWRQGSRPDPVWSLGPERLHWVPADPFVGRDNRHAGFDGLTDQHAIEGIVVDGWEFRELVDGGFGDGQFLNAAGRSGGADEVAGRQGKGSLPACHLTVISQTEAALR